MRHVRLLALAAALAGVVAMIGATNAEARGRGHGGHGHAGRKHSHSWFMTR